MHRAAYVLAGFALASQLLALVRDRLLAAEFGATHTLDLYYAAFRVPDLLFATVASLLSLYALLPILSRFEDSEEGKMVSFLRQILLIFFIGMGVIAAVLFVLAPLLIPLIAPGIADAASRADLISLTRILLLQPIFLGASNILAALTQLRHRFFLYSVSPLLYNIGIIIGILVLYPRIGVEGLGWGVVLGALLHFLVQVPFFFAEKRKRLPRGQVWKPFFEVLKLSIPRTLALASGQISLLVLIALGSFFVEGSIAVFMFAYNLQAVPLTIIGVSYSVAAFPTLARLHAAGDTAQFRSHIEAALRHILFWSIPAMVLVVVLRAQLVRVVLGAGAFDWEATRLTAAALALFIISLCAQGMTLLIARAYYAAGKTKIPLILGILSVIVTIVSAFILLFVFQGSLLWRFFLESLFRVSDVPGTVVLMLALGYCLGALVQCGAGLVCFARDFHLSYGSFGRLLFQSIGASTIGGAGAYAVLVLMGLFVDINTLPGIFAQGAAAGIVGLVLIVLMLLLLKNQEILEAIASFKRRITPAAPVTVEPTRILS
ncbi:oligosaccharide flippase family protein [Acetobacteraceae bacterium]|nr:oligosaccharide flippase family protein [Candidatus Parcubacteria bacterium]